MPSFALVRAIDAIVDARAPWLNMFAKAVLTALARHADTDGVAYPSQQLLAEETGASPRKVWSTVRTLVEHGAIAVLVQGRHNVGSTRYSLAGLIACLSSLVVRAEPGTARTSGSHSSHVASLQPARGATEGSQEGSQEGGDDPRADELERRAQMRAPCCLAWCEGVAAGSGHPCSVPSLFDWLDHLWPVALAHALARGVSEAKLGEWFRAKGQLFARSVDPGRGLGFEPQRFRVWINGGELVDERRGLELVEQGRAKTVSASEREAERRWRQSEREAVPPPADLLKKAGLV